jgi:hypothetical protein
MLLAEPYEYLDLHHGQTATFRVDSYLDGEGIIHPTTITPRHVRIHMDQHGLDAPPVAGTPIHNQIPVLRIFGARIDEASPAPYWDVSSKTLRADLLTRFAAIGAFPIVITLTATGARPQKRYSVEVL